MKTIFKNWLSRALLIASLILAIGGVFFYQATKASATTGGLTAAITYSKNGGTTYATTTSARSGNVVRILATFNEAVSSTPVMKFAVDNGILAAATSTMTDATHYYYDLTVGAGDIATATVSLSNGVATNTDTVLATPTSGATFTVDNTAPTVPTVTQVGLATNLINSTNKSAVVLTGTAEANALVSAALSIGGATTTAVTQQLTGGATTFSITVDAHSLADGTLAPYVTATDAAGNTSTAAVTPTAAKHTILPTVTKWGNNTAAVTLAPNSTTTLTFTTDGLTTGSKTNVQNALTLGSHASLGYVWNGGSTILSVVNTSSATSTFNNDVIVGTISDAYFNTSTSVLLVDAAIASNQTMPDSSTGAATLSTTTPQVVISDPSQAVTLTVNASVTSPSVDVSALVNNGTGVLPAITFTAPDVNNNHDTIAIPSGVTITAATTSWSGVISAPTPTTVSVPSGGGQVGSLNTAIVLGSTVTSLTFDKGVRIFLFGQGGAHIGYEAPGATGLTEITNLCSGDSQTVGNALSAGGECKIQLGADEVVWTKHFTTFASYSLINDNAGGSGGGNSTVVSSSGNGSGSIPVITYCAVATYNPWSVCSNNLQIRSVASKNPGGCTLTPAQIAAEIMDCSVVNMAPSPVKPVTPPTVTPPTYHTLPIVRPTPKPTPKPLTLDQLIAVTKYGQTDNNVKLLQADLIQLGWLAKSTKISGYYGAATRTAVQKYQASLKKAVKGVKIIKRK